MHLSALSAHLGLHTIIELLSVCLSLMIFIFQLSVRSKKMNVASSVLACTFMSVGIFDLFHTLSYKGMPDFVSANGGEKAIYFWLAGRFAQTVGFFILAISPKFKISNYRFSLSLTLSLAFVLIISWAIFYHMEIFPRMFIEGEGLTAAKIYSEYVFLIINAVTGIILFSKSSDGDEKSQNVILAKATLLIMVTEFCFTLYRQHNDVMNFVGHILKAFSLIYIYRAILLADLLEPFNEVDMLKKELNGKIDNLKLIQVELERSRKIASLGAEVRGIAHDLNNVLMIVGNSANSILKIDDLNENMLVKRKVDQIKKAVNRSHDFLKFLVKFSKDVPNEKEAILLQGTCSDYVYNLQPLLPKGIKIKVECEEGLDVCLVRSDLEQIIFNLVLNARDAISNETGSIQIKAEHKYLEQSVDFLHYHIPQGEYVCLSVEDTGEGIKAEHLPNIFDPFYTTKEAGKGTGVGLATVIGIMQKNNGYVQVETKRGIGTKFTLYFLKSSLVLKSEDMITNGLAS